MNFAERMNHISPSQTLAITNRVFELKRQGEDVIGLGAGEPDFDTPEHIKQAAIEAIRAGYTKYTPSTGIPELKEAVVQRFRLDHGVQYEPDQVIASCGAKHALANAIFALADRGDEVIIFSPYWVTYPELVKLAGARPVVVPTDARNNFAIDLERVKKAITPRTRALILNNPVNPTGAVYNEDSLRALADLLADQNIVIIADEIYNRIFYGENRPPSLATFEHIRDRVVVITGVSKTYAMTGWRIGFALGPQTVISQMSKIQSHTTSNPTSISQWAAVAALTGPQEPVEKMVAAFRQRRDRIQARLDAMEGILCPKTMGAFYFFPDVSNFFGRYFGSYSIQSSADFCRFLLDEQKVALVPGEAFGNGNHVRISFATSLEVLEEAMDRIEEGLRKLK